MKATRAQFARRKKFLRKHGMYRFLNADGTRGYWIRIEYRDGLPYMQHCVPL